MGKDFRGFMFDYFQYVILDNANFEYSREELDEAYDSINKAMVQKLVPFDKVAFLITALACTIRAIKNRLKEVNPATSINNVKARHEVLKKIDLVIKKRVVSKIVFDDIKFTGDETKIILDTLRDLNLDNYFYHIKSPLGKKFLETINRKPSATYKKTYAASLDDSLKRLGIKYTSTIISGIFNSAGLIDSATSATINSYKKRGKTNKG